MSVALTIPGHAERYRDFDMMQPGNLHGAWQALHKDADDASDDRIMWAKDRAELLEEIDLWHWERSVEPLLKAAERVDRLYGMDVDAFRQLRAAIAKARGQS
jgi:hypothetical protein